MKWCATFCKTVEYVIDIEVEAGNRDEALIAANKKVERTIIEDWDLNEVSGPSLWYLEESEEDEGI